jgi:siroheme decarboxylase
MTGGAQSWSEKDKILIRLLQEDLPVCAEPYREVARLAGMEQVEVLARVREWIGRGVIRRLGASVRHVELGYKANCMVVWQVEGAEEARRAGETLAGFREVTHCYRRPAFDGWPYTLYTMVHGRDREDIANLVRRMAAAAGLSEYRMLYSVKEWKKTSMKYFPEGAENT